MGKSDGNLGPTPGVEAQAKKTEGDPAPPAEGHPQARSREDATGGKRAIGTAVLALGVVFGDIGTSPLYTVNACFDPSFGIRPTAPNVLGIISCIFWALTFVIGIKYALFILKADDDGEGGIFALLGLLSVKSARSHRRVGLLALAGIVGAALLYGDGVITPAISVLSALEGLEMASPSLTPFVTAMACAILVGLFMAQRWGVQGLGFIFGPVMLLWFVAIGALGTAAILDHPEILSALSPVHAARFFMAQPGTAFIALGAVVLCVTGGEALYADLGHFGRLPIRIAWFAVVYPALLLNYFGQGALLLHAPEEVKHPFFSLVPSVLTWPMIVLAAVAAVIASQAIITGVFSLTRQGTRLRLLPRFLVRHLSKEVEGRVFLPEISMMMMAVTITVVLLFRTSVALAGAYGIAVTLVMATTSILFGAVMRRVWAWSLWVVVPLVTCFLVVDLSFFGANVFKIASGGWFPILIAVGIVVVMVTWVQGRTYIHDKFDSAQNRTRAFIAKVHEDKPLRVPGTAVFLTDDPEQLPSSLNKLFRHIPVIHDQVVILSMLNDPRARVPRREQFVIRCEGDGFWTITGRHGFAQTPNVPRIIALAANEGLVINPGNTTYFLKRERVATNGQSRMMPWRKRLFAHLSRNAVPAGAYFRLPAERVVEVGLRVNL